MKTKNNCIENKIVLFPYLIAEEIDDANCSERASELRENRLLVAIKSTLVMIDRRDGILNNDITLNNAKKVCDVAIKENTIQYNLNLKQQEHLNKLIPFPEFAQTKRIA